MNWEFDEYGCWNIQGKDCSIFLQPRPSYCDRGRWLAHLLSSGNFSQEIDVQDGWPRYYFDLERAKAEIEAWLLIRGQVAEESEQAYEGFAYRESAQQSLKFCALSVKKALNLLRLSVRSFDCAIAARETDATWSQAMTRFYSATIEDLERLALIIGSPLTQQMLDIALGKGLNNLDKLTFFMQLLLEAHREDESV